MAYQIDFTAANYARRSWRKLLLRLLAAASVATAGWEIYDGIRIYNEDTLDDKLGAFWTVARPIEEQNAEWDRAKDEYESLLPYYRLVWAGNPTNFLNAASSSGSPVFGRNYRAARWKLSTGGECVIACSYVFDNRDKVAQAKGIEPGVVHSITSVVALAEGSAVSVEGVEFENLLRKDELNLTVKFALQDVKPFPAKEAALTNCVAEIAAMRKRVQQMPLVKTDDAKDDVSTAQALMMAYLESGRDKPDFPAISNVIDVAGWMVDADKFARKHSIPDGDAKAHKDRASLKKKWAAAGKARLPWARRRELDNEEIVGRTKELGKVRDVVSREAFKGFLVSRHEDCRKKLEPFTMGYDRSDVSNKPLIEDDLRERAAKAAGIDSVQVSFGEVSGAKPVQLETEDGKSVFSWTFSWMRWRLVLGGESAAGGSPAQKPITLKSLAETVRRALELGPGYVLEKATVDFDAYGNVSVAVLEGLLPVQKVEIRGKTASGESRAGGEEERRP